MFTMSEQLLSLFQSVVDLDNEVRDNCSMTEIINLSQWFIGMAVHFSHPGTSLFVTLEIQSPDSYTMGNYRNLSTLVLK